ncbi:TIGR01777 family protein [Saccharopolyspora erythraea]|uniref:TIGR01777 family oxidoreductase n=1 Tax=Saccharopolyspora erythraea TaxID=1836 RepID=UPI001BAA2FE1|nr:TIGR01777 family oxidoreductase [Saccharopolyspora erythraea]QUH01192.1 TIGR01777 family protein [Saccharopolyspora erythraea]
MRVVIAGSSGLIGTSLVPALRQARHEVVRLVRRRPEAPDERGWDPPAGRLDEDALEGADAVVNLCGAGIGDRRWTPERKRVLLDSRLRPTSVLAEAVAQHGVATMVNASAVGFYGDTGQRPVTESAPPGDGFLADLVRQWEAATAPASDAGARVVLARTGPVLSPAGGLLGRLRPLFSFLLGGRFGDGEQYLPWISLDDEVAALRFVLEHPEISGPVNLTGPTPVRNAEFARALGEAVGRPAPWVVPGFVLRAAVGELAEDVLGGQRAVPAVLEGHGFRFQHPTVRAALAAAVPSAGSRA